MDGLTVAYVALLAATGLLIAGTALALFLLQQRSRATVFSDVAFRATALIATVFYLSVFAQGPGAFGFDAGVLRVFSVVGFFLVAAFCATMAWFLWRLNRAVDGPVLVSAELLIGVRNRMEAMYGAESSRFLVYAVGKESASKAIAQLVEGKVVKPEALWRRLPSWWRTMGYGRLSFARAEPGKEVRVRIAQTFEARHPGKEPGCDLTRGYLAGLGAALVPDMDCEAQEIRCCSRHGGEACEFAILWFPREAMPPAAQARPTPIAVQEA